METLFDNHQGMDGVWPQASVATAIADVFRKNAISVGNKFTKMLKIFDKIDEIKSRRVI